MKLLAIIPARGGSKGIKYKNLKKVGNDSLLKRAIKSVINLMDVVVSTDNYLIEKEALQLGAKVPFVRPKRLAGDKSNTIDVVIHAVLKYEKLINKKFDYIFLIEPTSPFRKEKHIKKVIQKLETNKFQTVISVCDLEIKPENIFVKDIFLEKYIKNPDEKFEQRQNMNNLCRLNSAIYAINRNSLILQRNLLIQPLGYIEMTGIESINIDNQLDLELAKLVSDLYDL